MKGYTSISSLLLLMALLLLASCNSPMNREYNEATLRSDFTDLRSYLPPDQAELLGATIIRATQNDQSLEGLTYADILDMGNQWLDEQQRLADAKAEAERQQETEQEELRQQLREMVEVNFADNGSVNNTTNQDNYQLIIENHTDQDIQTVSGTLTISDTNDILLGTLSLKYDQPLAAGQEVQVTANTDIDQQSPSFQLNWSNLDNLQVSWEPQSVVFEDGTAMRVQQ